MLIKRIKVQSLHCFPISSAWFKIGYRYSGSWNTYIHYLGTAASRRLSLKAASEVFLAHMNTIKPSKETRIPF